VHVPQMADRQETFGLRLANVVGYVHLYVHIWIIRFDLARKQLCFDYTIVNFGSPMEEIQKYAYSQAEVIN